MNREIVLVGGMTGWGKSLWSKVYSHNAKRLLVFDPTASWPNVTFDEQEGGLDDLMNGDTFLEFLNDDQKKEKTFRVGSIDPDRAPQMGGLAFLEGRNLLVLEESSMLFEKGQRRLEPWLSRLVFLGRHQKCSLLVIAQRFMSIPIDIRSQANRVVTFNQHEPDDVSYLQSVFGKERTAQIPNLPRFRCFDRHNTEVYEYSIVDNVKRALKIKLDTEETQEYTSYYKDPSPTR